ncbi:MAG: signal peptide peptidase SppA [Candidatus Obscuribacterales bacterium]|nr:signal peptide peptidase SppA [Candidatus Obscuribacterales bacterium]
MTTFRPSKQLIIWILVGLSLLAIPVGLISSYVTASKNADAEFDSSPFRPVIDHLLVLELKGMIASGGDESAFAKVGTAGWLNRQLRRAQKDNHVKGVLLRINSPGGTVATSQEIQQSVLAFRKSGKPIVVSMIDVAASGGYYVACAADKIVALPGTITGSIGVIMNLYNLEGAEHKLGIESNVVKSGKFKDIGSFSRPMTAEERELLQGIIADTYDQFVTAVSEGRHMDVAAVKKIADGRIISGRQALAAGLVDQLGGYEEAVASLQDLSRQKFGHSGDLKVIDKRMPTILSVLMESASSNAGVTSLVDQLMPESMRFSYQKQPLWLMQ